MRITFIGGGNMAAALIGGLLAHDRSRASDIRIVDPAQAQRVSLAKRFGVSTFAVPSAEALDSEVWVLAVKPQHMRTAIPDLMPWLHGQLVISIAAGIRANDLSRWLGRHTRIVRAMPNTPALVGEGVTGLAPLPGLTQTDRTIAGEILGAVGETVWVDDESLLDAVTAVSGSGPAYVFHFMEAMLAGAIRLGLDADQAKALVLATFRGATTLASRADEPPSALRERVTSKGGTTAAALAVMTERGIADTIGDALEAARKRSEELGKEFGRQA
jgi:pyrroline-5-carboxylate reductase